MNSMTERNWWKKDSVNLNTGNRDFPGGPAVENLPSNAGDVGLIPDRGTKIPHAAGQLGWACAPQLKSLSTTTTEPTCSHNY